jgi:23S rRNA (pseudouridine1915-N3)-methyltransferase
LRPSFRAACDDYLRRLSRYTAVREVEVRAASRAPTPEVQRRDEAALLLARVAGGTDLVCLARTGEAWSSAQLAEQVSRWQLRARPIAVLVGGSYGLDDELLERAQARWSLGPLTLPHELARVIALEQLYRAWTILRGEPYHKARRNR